MSGRPGSWHLLGVDSDPLPGDVYEVSSEATHYDSTATAIRDQVARLRTMASGKNSLVGQYAPALEKSAGELADHLDQAQGRFDTVAAQLKRWEPVLDHGITRTATMLHQAETAQSAIDANQAASTPVDKKDDAAVAADHKRGNALSGAQGDLGDVVTAFHNLMHSINSTADDVAGKIDDASHDKLKDSWWDSHVRKWIHDHASLLKFIADVLTWIATAIIIVVLVIGTGGLALAAILTGLALVLHFALAANGDGSWTDVALDAFALVTLGSGKLLSGGAKMMLATREGAAGFAETSTAARTAFAEANGVASKATVWLSRSNPVFRTVDSYASGLNKFSQVLNTEFKGGRLIDVLSMGEKESAGLYKAIGSSIDKLGPGFLLNSAKGMMNATRVTFTSGALTDLTFKGLNPAVPLPNVPWGDGRHLKPALTNWSDWADEHTVPRGGYW
ncbi:MAG: spore cortex biosynthesis protein YabQ [Marmoricola sp.]